MDHYDIEKIAFQTPIGSFHYTVIPFGLKKVGATLQRAIFAIFHNKLHEWLEDYAYEIIVES